MGKHDDLPPWATPPPSPFSHVTGYTVALADVAGYEIRLAYSSGPDVPSMVSRGPWWALTFAGAHRKAKRLIERERRTKARADYVTRWDA